MRGGDDTGTAGQDRLSAALAVAGVCFGLDLIIRLETDLLFHVSYDGTLLDVALRLLLGQAGHLLIAVILGCVAGLAFCGAGVRTLAQVIVFSVNAVVVLNPIYYRQFFTNVGFSLFESGADLRLLFSAADSIAEELDALFYVNLGLLAVTSMGVRRVLYRPPRLPIRRIAWGLSGYMIAGGIALQILAPHPLHTHPVVSLLFPKAGRSSLPDSAKVLTQDQLYAPLSEAWPDQDGPRLAEALDRIRQRLPRPNVLFIVLESVGAHQLLPGGQPDSTITPFLARRAAQSVVFDAVYCTFPSTTRTHIPFQTGGPTITWGRLTETLLHLYTGPTLVGQMEAHGYRTALFSAQVLSFESLGTFLRPLGWDTVVDDDEGGPFAEKDWIHSWGVDDDAVWREAKKWLKALPDREQPFFLQLLTVSTHHPYGVPEGTTPLREGDERLPRYQSALHYADGVLQRIYDDLSGLGLLENTLVVIAGDHGQAFGRRHENNLTHRNFLYEENLRTFLMIDPAGAETDPDETTPVSHRLGTVGDVMPTLLASVGLTPPPLLGRDLFSPEWPPRLLFFHKSAEPPMWGLRDGRWKYVSRYDGSRPELYDLEADPAEQVNLAADHPEVLKRYNSRCASWYIQENDRFTGHLKDYRPTGGRGFQPGDLDRRGPKILAFGLLDSSNTLVEASLFSPLRMPTLWTQWVGYPTDRTVVIRFRSPRRRTWSFDFRVEAGWDVTWYTAELPLPLEEGEWQAEVDDGESRLVGTFHVTRAALPAVRRGLHPIPAAAPATRMAAVAPATPMAASGREIRTEVRRPALTDSQATTRRGASEHFRGASFRERP